MTETQLLERAFQDLINTKHLYQSIEIDFEPAISERAVMEYHRGLAIAAANAGTARAAPREETIKRRLLSEVDTRQWVFAGEERSGGIPFSIPPVKTLCSVCDDVTPFNLWNAPQTIGLRPQTQIFCLSLQCQGCRSNVIVFMVARNGSKIQLVGRSEFEQVKAPTFIPKKHRPLYSQAVIAFNCGQILAALFLLRTLIEQHMRTETKANELRGEDLCEAYNKILDADFKDRFPSFKETYAKLSDALHLPDPNVSLFESEVERVRVHFEGLDLFAKVKKTKQKLEGEKT